MGFPSPTHRPAVALLVAAALLPSGAVAEPRFTDVTAASGIDFVHHTGAFGAKWLPETLGSGVLLFDHDGDRLLDVLFLNGTRFPGRPGSDTTQAFFVNRGALSFRDATAESGLDIAAYCMGGAAGDLDDDGDTDLYLSCLGSDYLLTNEGGRFRDRSATAGIATDYAFGASVALLDADRDGDLDLFVARYATWSADSDLGCSLDGVHKTYCTPEPYPGVSPRFYRNRGDATFVDATPTAGIFRPSAKSLGVAVLDADDDGWPDIAVANDTQPNLLYRNRGDGTFEECGVPSGMAFAEDGAARGGMGIDAADFDGSGRQSLVIGNFANEMAGLYQNEGNLLFVDVAAVASIGRETLRSLTFATFFFDYDLDGHLDLVAANGHLEPEIESIQSGVRYAQPSQLFHNRGDGRFSEVTATAGGDLAVPRVARGAAWGDLDGDGRPEVVLTVNGGPAVLLANRGSGHGHWLQVELRGTRSNTAGLGARVELFAGGRRQRRWARTGSSYLSQSQVAPLFGLGTATTVERLTVRWPSGVDQEVSVAAVDRRIEVVEPP